MHIGLVGHANNSDMKNYTDIILVTMYFNLDLVSLYEKKPVLCAIIISRTCGRYIIRPS